MNRSTFDAGSPIFLQLRDRLLDEIARGKYSPGDRIPSVREMAVEAGVNPNTVQRALSLLEDRGVLVSRRGEGRYVADVAGLRDGLAVERGLKASEDYLRAMRGLGYRDEEIPALLSEAMKLVPAQSGTERND